jgi:hypothetical protein
MFLSPSVDGRDGTRRLDHRATKLDGSGMQRLRLLPSGDGWALVGADGRIAFSALGLSGRRRCLEFAREHGVITLTM